MSSLHIPAEQFHSASINISKYVVSFRSVLDPDGVELILRSYVKGGTGKSFQNWEYGVSTANNTNVLSIVSNDTSFTQGDVELVLNTLDFCSRNGEASAQILKPYSSELVVEQSQQDNPVVVHTVAHEFGDTIKNFVSGISDAAGNTIKNVEKGILDGLGINLTTVLIIVAVVAVIFIYVRYGKG